MHKPAVIPYGGTHPTGSHELVLLYSPGHIVGSSRRASSNDREGCKNHRRYALGKSTRLVDPDAGVFSGTECGPAALGVNYCLEL